MTVCGCRIKQFVDWDAFVLEEPKVDCPFCDGTGILKRTMPKDDPRYWGEIEDDK